MQRDIEEPFNRKSLKKLYKALNYLPDDERLFLAKKYLDNSGKPFSDNVMAEKEGMKPGDYTKKRTKIEGRLSDCLQLILDAERKTLRDSVDLSEPYESMKRFRIALGNWRRIWNDQEQILKSLCQTGQQISPNKFEELLAKLFGKNNNWGEILNYS